MAYFASLKVGGEGTSRFLFPSLPPMSPSRVPHLQIWRFATYCFPVACAFRSTPEHIGLTFRGNHRNTISDPHSCFFVDRNVFISSIYKTCKGVSRAFDAFPELRVCTFGQIYSVLQILFPRHFLAD
jgi:hypothetical protein